MKKNFMILHIKNIDFVSTVLKKMNFRLNMLIEIFNKNGIKEICYLSLKLKKLFKEKKSNSEEMADRLIYGILNNLIDDFKKSLREYFLHFV